MIWNRRRPDFVTLRRMAVTEQMPDYAIAERYGVSPKTAARWRQQHGIPSATPAPQPVQKQDTNQSRAYVKRDGPGHDAKLRKCLDCGTMFMSEWIGNRRCRRCKASTAGHGLTTVASVGLRR